MRAAACATPNDSGSWLHAPFTTKKRIEHAPREMEIRVLTSAEEEMIRTLPKPPMTATIRTTTIWIIEWLPPDEQRTGLCLHKWMENHRKGWSAFSACRTKLDVLRSIDAAASHTQRTGNIPVLHIEAHGGHDGLEGPDNAGGRERLSWHELTEPLQRLNVITRCNLVIVVAACVGFAGIGALVRGPGHLPSPL
jgi:hypothetical protein